MRKASGMIVTGATFRGAPPVPAWDAVVRPSRVWWLALAGLVVLINARRVGLIVATVSWLRGAHRCRLRHPRTGAGIGRFPR